MAVGVGLLLGAGVLLIASPWVWPRDAGRSARGRRTSNGGLAVLLRQAGMSRVVPSVFVALSVVLGLAAAAVAIAVSGVWGLGAAIGLLGCVLPTVAVSGRARRRRRAVRSAWPDLVDHLVAGLRAGLPLPSAIGSLAEAGTPETRSAFAEFELRVQASGVMGPALDELKNALADPVGDRVVETLRLAREVGGTELPSVLRTLAAALRADAAVRSEAEARQSWVVIAARLGVGAPWAVLLLIASRPEAAAAYNSAGGLALLGGGLVVTVVAYRLMIALGRLPEERRWLA
ncbi:type II secretion system F family protein [Pseudolysinimonas sp.]|uniref:type II secretion system F family protein n=1 Tax=Pseudolysinimonas sp. TaxID=2680009 RepID=UPI003F7E3037